MAAVCASLLAAFFAVTAILVFLFGSRVYRSSVQEQAANASARTLITYVTEKVDHFDQAGNVTVRDMDGIPALVLTNQDTSEAYSVYIYAYQGSVCELTVTRAEGWKPEDGTPILSAQQFLPKEVRPGLLYLQCVDSEGSEADTYVCVHSSAASGEEASS